MYYDWNLKEGHFIDDITRPDTEGQPQIQYVDDETLLADVKKILEEFSSDYKRLAE